MPYEKVGKNEPVCIADEVPFEIPGSWEWVRISDIFQIEMGQSPKGDSVGEFQHGIEFHQGKVYFGDKYIQESKQRTTTPTKIAEPNSVLLCVRAPVGKVNITNRKLCIGRGLCALKPLGNINIDFAFYLMETYESIFVKQATGTTFVAITGEVVKNQLIPLPPLGEQIRILEKIRKLLPLIKDYAHVEQANEKLTKDFPLLLKKSILQEAVQGKLVQQDENDEPASVLLERIRAEKQALIKAGKIKKDKNESVIFRRDNSHYEKRGSKVVCIDDEIPFEIPHSWEWVRLKSICTKLVDGDHNPPKGENFETKYIMASSTNINNNRLVELNKVRYLSQKVFEQENLRTNATAGDLFFTSVGSLGRSCVYEGGYNICFQRSVSVITTLIYNYYLKLVFDSAYFQNKVIKEATGTAQKGFYLNQLSEALIPVPPISEQQQIVNFVNRALSTIEAL